MRRSSKLKSALTATVAVGALCGGSAAWWSVEAQERPAPVAFTIADQPSLNFYGLPGLVDMPTAFTLPDGQYVNTIATFGGITRGTISFQFTPRLSASFRYSGIQDWNSDGFETYYDRSFDVRYQVVREGKMVPAITVGLQDLAGTGFSSAEYIVASKNFPVRAFGSGTGGVRLTAGLGWGRLGTSGSIGNPSGGDRPTFAPGDDGGEPSTDQWFRGPVAPFAGVEWQVNDHVGLKAEYSSDAYVPESVDRDVFDRKSRFNFGAEYQATKHTRLGVYYLYGSEIGFSAQFQLNPREPLTPMRVSAPGPVAQRPSRTSNPSAYSTEWSASSRAPIILADALTPILEAEGLTMEGLSVTATQAELRFDNRRYGAESNAIGRAARAMAQVMPPSVETFRLVPMTEGLALSAIVVRRSDLERQEFAPDATAALLSSVVFDEASPNLANEVRSETLYPSFNWALGPYIDTSYFDPDKPIRADAGVSLDARYRPAPGWLLAGSLRYKIIGNIGDTDRDSNTKLPPVRTNAPIYSEESDAYINRLYASYQWKLAPDVYGRVTGGYLESMFGGVSGEVLWKPQDSRLALGAEANYVKQREFDRLLGFQDYEVATGHLSAYYELGGGYLGQVDVGRYLAGDVGATFTLTREFANGWQVGGFFTLTDVSAEDFGEGSFDKGINLTIPMSWFLGQPSKQAVSTTIRPILRDGGARLNAPGRLYEQVREGHRNALTDEWSRVWN